MKSISINKQQTSSTNLNNSFLDKEVFVNEDSFFSIKIAVDNSIDYTNHQFNQTSGFEAYELIKEPIDSLFHNDMPDLMLAILKDALNKGDSIRIIQKFAAADNKFFWLSSLYEPKANSKGDVTSYSCTAVPISIYAIESISALYSILSKIENKAGNKAAEGYLTGFFENINTNYHSFVSKLSAISIVRTPTIESVEERNSLSISKEKQAQFTAAQYRVLTRKAPKTTAVNNTNNSLKKGA
jgi:hypothetical protein